MSNALRIFNAIITIFTGAVLPHETDVSSALRAASVEMIGMTTDEQTAARQDIELFAEAGLPLPPVVIRRHHDRAGCNGREGLHRLDGERSVIDICTTESGAWEARTLLHELNHAWAFHFLTPEHKAAFQQVRGWKYWLDYEHAVWGDNGAEQAAEIMVWGLSEHALQVVLIGDRSCSQLRAGYVALTGLEPLHGDTASCDGHTNVQLS